MSFLQRALTKVLIDGTLFDIVALVVDMAAVPKTAGGYMSSRYEIFCVVMALLRFFEDMAAKKGLVFYKKPAWFLEPHPTEFPLVDGIVLLEWNGFISSMLTPWGKLDFAAELVGQGWSECFDTLRGAVVLKRLDPIQGLNQFIPHGVLYYEREHLRAPQLQLHPFLESPDEALADWWTQAYRYRIQQLRCLCALTKTA